MRKITIGGYERISKQTAKKMYDAGEDVYICPVNLRPDNMWMPATKMDRYYPSAIQAAGELDFIEWANEYQYYNCQNSETGRYLAFYKK